MFRVKMDGHTYPWVFCLKLLTVRHLYQSSINVSGLLSLARCTHQSPQYSTPDQQFCPLWFTSRFQLRRNPCQTECHRYTYVFCSYHYPTNCQTTVMHSCNMTQSRPHPWGRNHWSNSASWLDPFPRRALWSQSGTSHHCSSSKRIYSDWSTPQ